MKKDVYSKESKKQAHFGGPGARFANKVRPDHIWGTLRRLVMFSGSEAKRLAIVLGFVFTMSIMNLIGPRVIGEIVDYLYKGQTGEGLFNLITILAIVYAISSLAAWLGERTVVKASQTILNKMRNTLFYKLSKLPISYFDTHSHGDIISRFTNDIDSVSTVFSESTTILIRSVMMVTGSLAMMLYLNPILSLGVLLCTPLIYGLSSIIAKRSLNFFKSQSKQTGIINGKVEESVYGLNIIQSYNQEKNFLEDFKKRNDLLYRSGRSAQLWAGFLMPAMHVINNLSYAIIGLLGGYMAIEGYITVGVVASFIIYTRQFIRPLNELASIYNSLMAAIAGSQRVFAVLDELEETELSENEDCLNIEGNIEFDHVDFSYIEGYPVIKDLTITITPGMKVAIVGPTGAGKTTIVNLITRFYGLNSGEIRIDGMPIESINRHALRQEIGFVLQDTYLFSGSIYDNILYGKLDADQEAIIRAAKMAGAHDFITKLPHQYETNLSYGGMNLSQGERQLITIARAVLMNPRVLILDEATSSIDIATEQVISKSMIHLMDGRTSFIIAHRLSTIVNADLIMVLNDGQLIESGNHDALMAQEGFYSQMYRVQTHVNI